MWPDLSTAVKGLSHKRLLDLPHSNCRHLVLLLYLDLSALYLIFDLLIYVLPVSALDGF